MALPEDEEAFEHTLLVVREVSVFKIPPRSSSGAYKCGEWLQSDRIWSGRLRVVSLGDKCQILLEDPNSGELFAACHVKPGHREASVETVADSSRYFVLRIEDGGGKHAFVGLGFTERNEAFDFNVALSDHEKYVKRELEKELGGGGSQQEAEIIAKPSLDLKLKEGETIRINVKTKSSSGPGMFSNTSPAVGAISSSGHMKAPLAPPPGGGRLRSPLPPPPNDTRSLRHVNNSAYTATSSSQMNSSSKEASRLRGDPLADLSQLEVNLPTVKSGASGSSKSSGAGWAVF